MRRGRCVRGLSGLGAGGDAATAITKGGGANPDSDEESVFELISCDSDDSRCSSLTTESSLGDEGRTCLVQ